ncbi:VOC family protein [Pseudomonas sp. A-R-19]|uniref:VOC family protein n=1 Tax=Pseudomonas sp. A-R-19 TaxID=2832403 RepID=UPI001CBE559E|nr:VOC family protein [Pseudomonas sp. A-R-19]
MSQWNTRPRLTHVGIYCYRLDLMVPFYQRWFGMLISDHGIASSGAQVVYLTIDADEHHQIALISGRNTALSAFNQVSFRIDSLEQLLLLAREMHAADVTIIEQKDHGNAWSFYVADPEGNRLELYCPTPWHVSQPTWWSLDLLTDEPAILFAKTQALIQETPGTRLRSEWSSEMLASLNARSVPMVNENKK